MQGDRLELVDLRHRFGELVALHGVAFEVGQGELVGLVGRNGVGKTTTMRAVMGILRPDAGEVRWRGHPVGEADRLRFGYMPEERGLYPQMRLLHQVGYFAPLHGIEKQTAVKAASGWLERLGLGARAQEKLVALSHGNQQRVQLAVALVQIAVSDVPDDAAARTEVDDGRLEVALSLSTSPETARVVVKQTLSATSRALLAATVDEAHLRDALMQAGLPISKVLGALAPVPVATTALQPPPSNKAARAGAALAAALLMYLSLGMYGAAVANGVAQEKTSRTAEALLAAVRPSQLLTGKVLGIGLTGLGQLAIAAAAGLIANAVVHSARIPASVWVLLPAFLLCFLAGFLLYAFAFAAAGALGHIAPWELPVDALLMLASIYGMIRLASRVYGNALIQGGARLTWCAALRRA